MARDISEAMRLFEDINAEERKAALVGLQLIAGQIPEDRLTVLALNRYMIRVQKQAKSIPVGMMPMLAGLALNIIDGVPDLADRRVLMSYYWHAEDVYKKKIPDILKRHFTG